MHVHQLDAHIADAVHDCREASAHLCPVNTLLIVQRVALAVREMIGAVTVLLGLVLAFLGSAVYFFYGPMPTAASFPVPPVTGWRPGPGLRAGAHSVCRCIASTMHTSCSAAWPKFSVDDYRVQPIPDQFHTMHVGLENADNVWTASAPMFEMDWIAELEHYVTEGPTLVRVLCHFVARLSQNKCPPLECRTMPETCITRRATRRRTFHSFA